MLNVAITWFIYFLESNFLKYIGNLVEEWVTRQVTLTFLSKGVSDRPPLGRVNRIRVVIVTYPSLIGLIHIQYS